MKNNNSTSPIWSSAWVGSRIVSLLIAILIASCGAVAAGEIFDMDAIHDPSTLEIEVLQDWHDVDGEISTRQKLVSINVGSHNSLQ